MNKFSAVDVCNEVKWLLIVRLVANQFARTALVGRLATNAFMYQECSAPSAFLSAGRAGFGIASLATARVIS